MNRTRFALPFLALALASTAFAQLRSSDGGSRTITGNLTVTGNLAVTGTTAATGAQDFTGALSDSDSALTIADNCIVDGAADLVQFTVQGHSTQTSALAVFENSGGTDQVTISNAGVINALGIPVFPTGGVTLGSTTITEAEIGVLDSLTATKAEIQNVADVSAQLQAVTEAGAITVDGTIRRAELSGGAYAITLAVPGAAAIGAILVIEYAGGDTDAVTLALTNVIGESGGTTATFNADGEGMVLIGTTLGWVVLAEFGGVTLA